MVTMPSLLVQFMNMKGEQICTHRRDCWRLSEECGILNGCENGRCVRVQEGYTCDCFAGYTLDLSRMACIGRRELTVM
ncbi:hypothetical protein GOODEAATRI_018610 [Goodea atripinnis]|uniref:EGF-like domain-containing protein n=1 Tax=Goodea atripinnis TaxID=208336 RepID=A0ABV0PPX0_9TELE